MAVVIRCSNAECRKSLRLPDRFSQKPLSCPACGQPIDAAASLAESGASVDAPLKADSSRDMVKSATRKSQVADDTQRPRSGKGATLPGQIGRFVIQSRLGAGAFGTVYRAYDPHLEREVALKVPNPGVLDSPKRVARFLREAKSAANLRHPHIVPVYDAGRDNEQYYIATAFIAGQPLADRIEDQGNEFRQAAIWTRELAEALAYAHEQRIVHRDVKPANCMVDEEGHLHLMDFGLAFRQEEESRLTNDGTVLGTPAYMAPEQAAGREAGPAADQYSVGVILYELLTGRTPFAGPVPVVIHNQIHTDPDPPHRHRRNVSKDLETICLKTLSKESGQRYDSCQALADDLRRWLEGEPIIARRVGPVERLVKWTKRNPLTAGLVATVALVLVAGTAISTAFGMEANRRAAAEAQALKQATEAAERAEAEAKRAKQAQVVAITAETRATREAALATLDKGLVLCQRGDSQFGLLTLVKALELAERAGDPLIDDACRLNLTAWAAEVPTIIHCHPTPVTIHALAFHPDGNSFAYALRSGTVRLVSRGPQLPVAKDFHHSASVHSIAFDRTGARLITACDDGEIRRWDVQTGEEITPSLAHTSTPSLDAKGAAPDTVPLRFTIDGSGRTIVSHRGSSVLIWRVSEENSISKTTLDAGAALTAVQIANDGMVVWGTPAIGGIACWDTQTLQQLHAYPTRNQANSLAAIGEGGIVAADYSGNVTVIQSPGAQPRTDSVPGGIVSVAASTERNLYAVGTNAMYCHIHDALTGNPITPPLQMLGRVMRIAFGPGALLAAIPQNGGVHVWQLPASEHQRVVSTPNDRKALAHLALSDEYIYRVDEAPGSMLHRMHLPSQTGFLLSLPNPATESQDGHAGLLTMPDGNLLLLHKGNHSERRRPRLTKWQPNKQTLVYTVELTPFASVTEAVLAGDGSRLAVVGTPDGNRPGVAILDAATGRLLGNSREVRLGMWPKVGISRNGDRVFAGFVDGQTISWDAVTGNLADQEFRTVQVNAVATSRSGRSLVIGPHDGVIRHLDPETFRQLSPTIPLDAPCRCLAVTDDDRQIIATSTQGDIRFYRTGLARQIGPDFHPPHAGTEIATLGQVGSIFVGLQNGEVTRYTIPSAWVGRTADVKSNVEFLVACRLDDEGGLIRLSSEEIAERGQQLERVARTHGSMLSSESPDPALIQEPEVTELDSARQFVRDVTDGNGTVCVVVPGEGREIWCNSTGALPNAFFEIRRLAIQPGANQRLIQRIVSGIRNHPIREARLTLASGQLALCLNALGDVPTLEQVMVYPNGSRLPDLSPLQQVSSLQLIGASIDLPVATSLAGLPKLESLNARQSSLSSEGLSTILGSKSLRTLFVANSNISTLTALDRGSGLTHLDFSGTAIGDDSVPAFTQLRQLLVLDLRSTNVTLEGVDEIRRTLPACVVRTHSQNSLQLDPKISEIDVRHRVPVLRVAQGAVLSQLPVASLLYVDIQGQLVKMKLAGGNPVLREATATGHLGIRAIAASSSNWVLSAINDGRIQRIRPSLDEPFEEILPASGPLGNWAAHPHRNVAAWCRLPKNQGPIISIEDREEQTSSDLGFGYDPTWSGDGESFWYTSSDQFGWCIVRRRDEVITKVRIPTHPAASLYPAPNADGAVVAFAMKSANGTMQLGMLELATSKLTQLTASGDGNTHAIFSPDGSYIALTRSLRAPASLVVVDIETGAERVIATDAMPIRPVWMTASSQNAAVQPAQSSQ